MEVGGDAPATSLRGGAARVATGAGAGGGSLGVALIRKRSRALRLPVRAVTR